MLIELTLDLVSKISHSTSHAAIPSKEQESSVFIDFGHE